MFTCEICSREMPDNRMAIEDTDICTDCFYDGTAEAEAEAEAENTNQETKR